MLENTGIENNKYYTDIRYAKSAAGIAYAGLEQAAKWLIRIRNKNANKVMSLSEIQNGLKLNFGKTILENFNDAYQILHINIYYVNDNRVSEMKEGIACAKAVIDLLKPYDQIAEYKDGGVINAFEYHLPLLHLDEKYTLINAPAGHNAYAVCTCGELFTYDSNSPHYTKWKCPKCNSYKEMKFWAD